MNPVITSFIFGITIAVSIGPIAMLIINRSINCGLRVGITTGIAAASADLTYAIISFVAGSAIYGLLVHFEFWLRTAASLILLSFGSWMLWNAVRNRKKSIGALNNSCDRVFGSTYALTMANPLTIVAFSSFAAQSAITGFSTVVLSSIALFTGSLIIQMGLAFFGDTVKKHIGNSGTVFYLNVLSSIAIISMGLLKVF